MAGRKIRDEEDARACLAAATAGGLSPTEWARQNGVDGRSLFAWTRNIARGHSRRGTKSGRRRKATGIVELVPDRALAGSRYLVRCGRLSVEVDDHFDEATLARLLRVVAAC